MERILDNTNFKFYHHVTYPKACTFCDINLQTHLIMSLINYVRKPTLQL